MGDAEVREYATGPSQGITYWHCLWNVLQDKDHDDQESSRHEMNEQSSDLSIDIRAEDERSHICEWNDSWWVQHEQDPDTVKLFIEDEHEHDHQADRDIRHEDIEEQVR